MLAKRLKLHAQAKAATRPLARSGDAIGTGIGVVVWPPFLRHGAGRGTRASMACLSAALSFGADPFENFAVLVIPGAKKDGFLDVAAGHLHEIAVFVLFLDQWAQSIGAID
jgi:hypothetical protein